MLPDNDLKAVCTVTQLAKKLEMSRARFYQLQKIGVFPPPVYCICTKRPFYPLDLQQECLNIHKTGIGYDGQPILFYNSRQNKCEKSQNQQERKYKDITDTLKKMGLAVSPSKVKNALETLYPDKLAQQSVEGAVIRDLFNYFRKGL